MRQRKRGWQATKAGDGGVIPKVKIVFGDDTSIPRNANSRRSMTCVPKGEWGTLVETRDPFDRAHSVRDGANMLVPAGKTDRGVSKPVQSLRAKPRLYPACYMTSSGISFETAEDLLHEKRVRALHGDTRPVAVIQIMPASVTHQSAVALYESMFGPQKGQKMRNANISRDNRSRREKRDDSIANKWASAHGVDLSARSGGKGRD